MKDSSIHDSMTRWITLHATQDVLLARNVGYKSIGHGFYLEDGTEIDNKLTRTSASSRGPRSTTCRTRARCRASWRRRPRSLRNNVTPRRLPTSDYDHPTVFWIMNGWNDFQYNMAAGAGTCGACYWLLPGAKQRRCRRAMKWEAYASMQDDRSPDAPG